MHVNMAREMSLGNCLPQRAGARDLLDLALDHRDAKALAHRIAVAI